MKTVQRYSGKGNNAFPASPTAQNTASLPSTADQWQPPRPLPVAEFLSQHAYDLRGLPTDEIDEKLRDRLASHPVSYSQPQDALTLLENLLPAQTADAHYACLLRGNLIVGLVSVNQNNSLPGEPTATFLSADDLDVRYLTGRLLDAGATQLLLLSTQYTRCKPLTATEKVFMTDLQQALDLMEMELIDWLVQSNGQTPVWSSWITVADTGGTIAPVSASLGLATATVQEFVTRNADLWGVCYDDLATQLTERLQTTPIQYSTILDCIGLLRAFVPAPPACVSSHYALLLRDFKIVGLLWLPISHDIETGLMFDYEGDTRQLVTKALQADADNIVMATALNDGLLCNPWPCQGVVNETADSLAFVDIELHEWLFLYPDSNMAFRRVVDADDIDDEGVEGIDLAFYGINNREEVSHV